MCWNKFIHTSVLSLNCDVSIHHRGFKTIWMPQVGMWWIHQTADNMNIQEHCHEPHILPNINFLELTAVNSSNIFLDYNSQIPSELSEWEFNYLITDFFHCCNGSALKVTAFLSEVHKDVFWYPFLHHVQWAVHDFWDTSGELVREILYQFLRDTFCQRSNY